VGKEREGRIEKMKEGGGRLLYGEELGLQMVEGGGGC